MSHAVLPVPSTLIVSQLAAGITGVNPHPLKASWSSLTKILAVLSSHVASYCDHTTLHGMRYITIKSSHWCERLLWLVLCILGVATSMLLIQVIWSRFQESPTITMVETTVYPIWNVPFPAVTLCNVNKVYRPAAIALAQNLSRQGLNETVVLQFLSQLANVVKPTSTNISQLYEVEEHLATNGINITALMKQMAQPCSQLLIRCHWQGQRHDCSTLFRLITSVEGFCCAFNYNALSLHLDNTKEEDHQTLYVNGAGSNAGLSVVLDCEPNTYFSPTQHFYGVYALLHDPDDYPETSLKKALVQPQHAVWVETDAEVIESDPGVRRLGPQLRQCWFDDEVTKLLSSDDYNYHTCMTECRALTIIRHCGCLPFYYPHIYDNETCSVKNVPCLLLLQSESHTKLETNVLTEERKTESNNTGLNCSCLQQCSDRSYHVEIQEAELAIDLFDSSSLLRGLDNRNISLLHVYFAETTCMKYKRMATMSWDVLLATFGGVIGLCMGGSIISLVELIYYFTIRLWFFTHPTPANVSPGRRLPRKLHRPILMQVTQHTTSPLDMHSNFHQRIYFPHEKDKIRV